MKKCDICRLETLESKLAWHQNVKKSMKKANARICASALRVENILKRLQVPRGTNIQMINNIIVKDCASF